MNTGIIYLITNTKNLESGDYPVYYIGSKTDSEKFDNYWSSSKYLLTEIKKVGIQYFTKSILQLVEYSTIEELLKTEEEYQLKFFAAESKWFYNMSYATGKFFCNGQHIKNTIWVNNGIRNKRINHTDILKYANNGYNIGRLGGDYNKSRIYINDGTKTKSIAQKDLEYFTSKNWKVGRLCGNQHGKRWVHNKELKSRKLIPETELQKFISEKWELGWSFK